MSLCIGIDLGTTYSCVYSYDITTNEINVCKNELNENTTPSYIKIDNNNVLIGKTEKELINDKTFYNMKRFIGKKYNECINDLKFCSFKYKDIDNNLKIEFNNKEYLKNFCFDQKELNNDSSEINLLNPQDISSIFLRELKKQSELHLNYQIKNCVITVPAYFNNTQRELTKQAGINAGLNVLQIINEPCAAAFAYQLNNKKSGKIMIFDFGGGTLDISILNVSNEGLIVINTIGDNHLGGEDIDNILLKKCLSEFIKQHNIFNKSEIISICQNQSLIQKLRKECEKSKILLSKEYGFNVNIINFYNHKDLNVYLNYQDVNELLTPILNRCIDYINKSLIVDKVNILNTISDIVLIGGSTKLEILKDKLNDWINKNNKNITLHDEINPDESVAYGACLHCKNLMLNTNDKILLDITSHSLGVETKNGKFEIIIPKNTIKPCKFKKIFSIATENQREFLLNIYEGENEYVKNNLLIKSIKYDNIPPSKPGDIKFEIEFIIDENNIFSHNMKIIN